MTGIMGLAWSVYSSRWGKILAACMAGLFALKINNMYQVSVGAKKERIRIGKANDKAVSQSTIVRRKSVDPNVRGLRDPNAFDN